MTDIIIPNVGESVSEVTIAQWFKKVGDTIKKDDPILELETDKAAQEIVSPADGIIEEILASEGDNVAVGTLVARINSNNSDSSLLKEVPASSKTSSTQILVPNLGESVSEVTVASWNKNIGDNVFKDETIVELETDKASQEIVAPMAGIISCINVIEGETASVGQVLCELNPIEVDEKLHNNKEVAVSDYKTEPVKTDKPPMPSAERLIKENNLISSSIKGNGKDGRITKGDTLSAIANTKLNSPVLTESSTDKSGVRVSEPREERVRMSRLRQTISRRLKDAQNTAAMLTTYNEVDMSNIMRIRNNYKEIFVSKHGVKLGFMSFFVKACVQALKDIPAVNAEIDGTDIIYKNYYDISVAVGTPKGLVVPVLRGCDSLSLGGIEKGIGDLGAKARDGLLSMDDMMGGTFTISNGGVYGSLMSSPILNPPQVGILGMHKIEKRPVVIDDKVVIRPMMYLALSYDHRIVDGKEAVTFLVRVKECLEDPERLLLDL
jgi:2-oxoglutarate dehydrogenase E2 component (dihydrolipoamide succinyltransferase)